VTYDVAIVGAGILGLAHAYQAARRGLKVLVCERHAYAQGASIRNFGMIWPIGQPLGDTVETAHRSREAWLTVLAESGIWHERTGSLHVAYHDDEAAVLREFAADPAQAFRESELWDADRVRYRFPRINPAGLQAGLWSPLEVCVDPRRAVGELPCWLTERYGVAFAWETAAWGFDAGQLRTSRGSFAAPRLIVCSGDELQMLYPEAFAKMGMKRCKLQMMRTVGYGPEMRVGTMLAAGLTLKHYKSFANCPSLAKVAARYARELPEYERLGIHVLVSQNGNGELVLGDSHEYDAAIDIFDKPHIDELVLDYLRRFLVVPELKIAARWAGYYMKHPTRSYIIDRPEPNVTLVTATGGTGMTLSFGLAEKAINQVWG